ncbi:MAG: single-stranded DNA-binding protein [Selenomonadaceae bacterium]|jgi:single-strand DNA-binding protein|nr:single-stranded DNA-binding protein [Selenomonadaceae bacterium]MDY2684858.1 single-stranded DNA-binding protein [Selenomonadaceae bacterium]
MNKAILTGRLTRDPEVRYTKSGKAVASFSLAVDRRFGRKNAEANGQPTADFINCVAWDRHADFVGNYLVKGSPVLVEGRIQSRSYETQEGQRRYVTEVVVDNIEFNGPRPEGAGQPGNNHYSQQAPAQAPQGGQGAPQGSFGPELSDDEIPF